MWSHFGTSTGTMHSRCQSYSATPYFAFYRRESFSFAVRVPYFFHRVLMNSVHWAHGSNETVTCCSRYISKFVNSSHQPPEYIDDTLISSLWRCLRPVNQIAWTFKWFELNLDQYPLDTVQTISTDYLYRLCSCGKSQSGQNSIIELQFDQMNSYR